MAVGALMRADMYPAIEGDVSDHMLQKGSRETAEDLSPQA